MTELEALKRVLSGSSDPDNPPAEVVRDVLETSRTIAVVGLSRDPAKAARRVPSYLAAHGYEVIPVNPNADRILGRDAVDDLSEVEEEVDVVLVFRPPEEAGEVILQAMGRAEEPVIWVQEGIRNDDAAGRARKEGWTVVQDLCAFKAHRAVFGH